MSELNIIPARLKVGDKVGIVAPARKISENQLQPAISTLESWGLKPVLARNIFSGNHSYLAGSDEERRSDFQSMIDDRDVRAIFSARGGYGSTRIIESIDFSPLENDPKWIIGFSDVTAFHLRLSMINVASIHATMPIFYGRAESREDIVNVRETNLGSSRSGLRVSGNRSDGKDKK